jgi:phosphomannomutase/phosphoglucomutase
MRTIFREYDIRGIFEKELNEQSVKLIGHFLGKKIKGERVVAIGYDARTHSPILRDYLTSGLNSAGCKVLDMGLVATPVNYFSNYITLTNNITTDASIMITGSHNPSEYNGFKITINKTPFFGEDIYNLGNEITANSSLKIPTNTEAQKIDVKSAYINYMLKEFSHLKGLNKKIIIDCGNGVAGTVIIDIFNGLELNYQALFVEPNGTFPNHHPDPSVEENLRDVKRALQESGDISFAYDGDADRIAVLTHKYNIKGDQMALLYAMKMDNPTVIGEVKCSQVMYDELNKRGAKAIMYKTGHSNLKVKMRETNADLACEVSGHIFFKNRYFGYDDAIYATLRMLELINDGIDIDKEIDALPKLFSTDEIKIKTTDREKFKIIDVVKELLKNPPSYFPKILDIITVDGVRINFEHGWGLVRASNTTPILVTRFEADREESAKEYKDAFNRLIADAKRSIYAQ